MGNGTAQIKPEGTAIFLAPSGSRRGDSPPDFLIISIDDLGYSDIVERLQQLVHEMDNDLGIEGIGPSCRAIGLVENPAPLLFDDGARARQCQRRAKTFP